MIITLSATVGPRPVRCRNNSRTLHTHSHKHRGTRDGTAHSQTVWACSHNRLHYIHYSSQRASPPPRCTCAHVSQNTSPPRHGVSSCRPAHLSCAAGHPDLSAVLPPCMTSLAGHEESVEAFFPFLSGLFFIIVIRARALLFRPMASKQLQADLHRRRHLLHRDAFASKLCLCLASISSPRKSHRDQACSFVTRGRGFPALFNVSPVRRRGTTCSHRNLSPRLLSCPPRVA